MTAKFEPDMAATPSPVPPTPSAEDRRDGHVHDPPALRGCSGRYPAVLARRRAHGLRIPDGRSRWALLAAAVGGEGLSCDAPPRGPGPGPVSPRDPPGLKLQPVSQQPSYAQRQLHRLPRWHEEARRRV